MDKIFLDAFKALEDIEDVEFNENFKVFFDTNKPKQLNESVNSKKLNEELIEDKDAFWKMRETISSVSGDKYDEVNLVLDGDKIRPLEEGELANKFAVSVEHADKNDFKTREEIEQIAKDNNVEKIMFFVFKGQYGGEYSFLVKDEPIAEKIAKEYKQESYGKYDEKGKYEPVYLKEDKATEEINESLKEMNDIAEELYNHFDEKDCYYEIWPEENAICAEISWGDWKHDHLFFDYEARKFLREKGYEVVNIDTDITEEDGSDTYSAIHTLTLKKIGLDEWEKLEEDTVKQGNAWVNKGKEGTHGKFKTKKEADAQRKAMFAKGFKEDLEDISDDTTIRKVGKFKKGRTINKKNILKEEKFDINNPKEVEEAKELLDKEKLPVEQIVDVDAETVDKLKDSYVGDVVLQCKKCRTLIYKNPDSIEETDEGGDGPIYNKEEQCPHCGAKDGYNLVGQIATADVQNKEEVEEETTEEVEVEDNVNKKDLPELEFEENEVKIESFDNEKFDTLLNEYLNKTFSNVDNYKTIDGSINLKNNFILEGIITYKSGKQENVNFNFELENTLTEDMNASVVFKGSSDKFSKFGNFVLESKICEKELKCESLSIK